MSCPHADIRPRTKDGGTQRRDPRKKEKGRDGKDQKQDSRHRKNGPDRVSLVDQVACQIKGRDDANVPEPHAQPGDLPLLPGRSEVGQKSVVVDQSQVVKKIGQSVGNHQEKIPCRKTQAEREDNAGEGGQEQEQP